jgi:protease IV
LVDGLWYKDQVEDALKKVNGNPDKWLRVDVEDYIKDHRADLAAGAKKGLALVLASGSIVSGDESAKVAMGESNIGSDSMVRWLKKAGENKDVAAVVLRVDSPGGSALASDVIWRQVAVLRKTKPVVVSMSDVAASGGYYISMGADAIVAQPGTITGSIGVVSGKFVVKGLLDWIDYRQETLKRGQNADLFSAYDKFTPEQEMLIQGQMEGFYKTFVTKASEGRKKTYDQIDQIAQGRIWSGEEALKNGLVDRLGGIDTAIALAKEKAKIGKDEPVRIQIYPRPKSFLEALFPDGADDLEQARALSHLPPELVQIYRDYESIRPMASEPFVLYTPARVRM